MSFKQTKILPFAALSFASHSNDWHLRLQPALIKKRPESLKCEQIYSKLNQIGISVPSWPPGTRASVTCDSRTIFSQAAETARAGHTFSGSRHRISVPLNDFHVIVKALRSLMYSIDSQQSIFTFRPLTRKRGN